jgi:ABC transporter substrate binding protein
MKRRQFITLLGGAAAWPFAAPAQTPGKRPLIVCLVGGSKAGSERFLGEFSQGMRELGYVEGRDYGFEVRYAEGDITRIPQQAEDLVGLKPDIIVSGTMAGLMATKKLTDTTPIVSLTLIDPVGFGVAARHSRPGGNVTGVSRVRPAQGRCHCHEWRGRNYRGKAGDSDHADRLRGGGKPGRHRSRREPGATGRQRYRHVKPDDRSWFQTT